jgi:DNA-binding NtrC family response regulator
MTGAKQQAGRVLVADDEPLMRELFEDLLGGRGYEVTSVSSGNRAIAALKAAAFDVVVSDVRMPDGDGTEVLRWVRQNRPELPVLIVTGHATLSDAVKTIKGGAWDYLEKPFDPAQLLVTVGNAVENFSLRRQNERLRHLVASEYDLKGIVAHSRAMRATLRQLRAAANPSVPVLVSGESGAGKTLIARALHANGERRAHAPVTFDCRAADPATMSTELFGGWAVGAAGRLPKVVEADGSTLIVDNIGELSLDAQRRLLTLLEDGLSVPVDGQVPRRVDVRVVTTTNRPLQPDVDAGNFLPDLFVRLSALGIDVPPLRSREADILPLARRFLASAAKQHDKAVRDFDDAACLALQSERWPGNVRELSAVVEQAVLRCGGQLLVRAANLRLKRGQRSSRGPISGHAFYPSSADLTLQEYVAEMTAQVEAFQIRRALDGCDGNRVQCAKLLGISIRTLHYKLKQLKIG